MNVVSSERDNIALTSLKTQKETFKETEYPSQN